MEFYNTEFDSDTCMMLNQSSKITEGDLLNCVTPFIPPYPFPSYLPLLLFIYPHFPYLA